MNNNAAIIGYGIVGQATANALGIKYHYDKLYSRSNIIKAEIQDIKYLFICAPTPTIDDICDITEVENIIREFGNNHIYIIRSTVTPGTADKMMIKYSCEIVSNPEFLTMSTATEDAINPDIVVLGGNKSSEIAVRKLFYRGFKDSMFIETDNKTAEMIKYAINTFFATKTLFANYLYKICKDKNIDYDIIKEAMYMRKWIGKNHLNVPYEGKFGVGGNCLPKDLISFASYSQSEFFYSLVKFMKQIKREQNGR